MSHGVGEAGVSLGVRRAWSVCLPLLSEAYRKAGLFGALWLSLDFYEKAANRRKKTSGMGVVS